MTKIIKIFLGVFRSYAEDEHSVLGEVFRFIKNTFFGAVKIITLFFDMFAYFILIIHSQLKDSYLQAFRSIPLCVFIIISFQIIYFLVFYGYSLYEVLLLAKCRAYVANTTPIYNAIVADSWANHDLIYKAQRAFHILIEPKAQRNYVPEHWIVPGEAYWWRQAETLPYYYGPDWTVSMASNWWRKYQQMCEFWAVGERSSFADLERMYEIYAKISDGKLTHGLIGAPELHRVDQLYFEFERGVMAAERYRELHPIIEEMHDNLQKCKATINAVENKNLAFPIKTWQVFAVVSIAIVSTIFVVASTASTVVVSVAVN